MTKEDIAGVLEKIATLLELRDENPFKIRAYINAAQIQKANDQLEIGEPAARVVMDKR